MLTKLKSIRVESISEPKHKFSIKIILLLLIGLFFSFFHKGIFLVILYEIVDFIKNTIKFKTQFFPVDFHFIFGVTAAYFISPIIGMIILILAQANRFMFGFFDKRHIGEIIRYALLFLIVPYLRFLPFLTVALAMLCLKYVTHYLLDILVSGGLNLSKIHYHLINFVSSLGFFYIINTASFFLR